MLLFIHSIIHSSSQAISIAPLQIHYYSEAILCRSLTPKCHSEELAQDLYVTANVGFEPTTLWMKAPNLCGGSWNSLASELPLSPEPCHLRSFLTLRLLF